MAIIRWDPFRDLITIREKMNRMFEEAVTSRGEEKDSKQNTNSSSVPRFPVSMRKTLKSRSKTTR
jgi:hypothetical protein